MGWIKRNLFFTIGGVIALALLGAAAYYNFKSWRDNRDAMGQLQDAYQKLKQLYDENPAPGNDTVNNIQAAKDQEQQVRAWIAQAETHFEPVPPIPNPTNGVITTEAFAGSLRKTIHDLQEEAKDLNVLLPEDYSFSFAAERQLVTFAPGSLDPLASHLGEVKVLCELLFSAKINALDGVQREIVSDNDATGPQSDYLSDKTTPTPDNLATMTPYMFTFRCFSADLADVLSKLASSNHGFIVKGINVMPAGAAAGQPGMQPGMPMQNGGGEPVWQPPVNMGTPAPVPGSPNGGLQTVLDEQLLRVTLAVEVVKLSKQ